MENEIKYEQDLSFPKAGEILKVIAFYFIFLFVYTGFSKLMDNQSLFTALRNAPLFLDGLIASFFSWLVPIIEIILAMILGFEKTRQYGWIGVIVLLSVFTIYTGWIVLISPYEPCTCGGLMTLLSWKQHLLFNIGSLLLAFFGYRLASRKTKT